MTTQGLTRRCVGSASIACIAAITLSGQSAFAAKTIASAADASKSALAQEGASRSPASQSVDVKDIRYVAKQGMVVIETSEPATYNTREVPEQNQVVIEIANANLPAKLKRPYVTKDFKQSIASINAYQDNGSTTARVVIQFSGSASAVVKQAGNALEVTADASLAEGGEPGIRKAIASDGDADYDYDKRIMPTSSFEGGVSAISYYGKPISIEVRNTPVRDVINLIAEQSGANIVLASDVDGSVSLKLKQIPWDQALLIVMKSQNLGYVREGAVLRIAPLQMLRKETDEARIVLDAQKAAEPVRVKVIPVSYGEATQLQTQVTNLLSARGKVTADARTNSLVVTDIPENLDRAASLVKALDTPPLQVLIEGKVIEARETFQRNFGINWSASGQQFGSGSLTGNAGLSVTPGEVPAGGNLNLRLGTLDILGDLDAALGLFESEDLVKVVSSPRIQTLNNQAASIVQSMNIPIPTSNQSGGVTTTTISYRPIELRLEVTPQITSVSDVILQVDIKREFAGGIKQGQTQPDINSRSAKTRVLVRNGQTSVIGGVYQSDADQIETGVPFLRSVPILGWLFKSRGTNTAKTELLLFLTPRILNAEQALPKEDTL